MNATMAAPAVRVPAVDPTGMSSYLKPSLSCPLTCQTQTNIIGALVAPAVHARRRTTDHLAEFDDSCYLDHPMSSGVCLSK